MTQPLPAFEVREAQLPDLGVIHQHMTDPALIAEREDNRARCNAFFDAIRDRDLERIWREAEAHS